MPMYWTFFRLHIFSILYSIHSIFSSKLTFKSWILTSEKKGASCPNWGQGGGLGNSGNARKKTFFSIDPFPYIELFGLILKSLRCFPLLNHKGSKKVLREWLRILQELILSHYAIPSSSAPSLPSSYYIIIILSHCIILFHHCHQNHHHLQHYLVTLCNP